MKKKSDLLILVDEKDNILGYLSKFHYSADYYSHGSENEICTIFSGKYNGDVQINPLEMEDFKWINLGVLHDQVKSSPGIFTPWFKLKLNIFAKVKDRGKD